MTDVTDHAILWSALVVAIVLAGLMVCVLIGGSRLRTPDERQRDAEGDLEGMRQLKARAAHSPTQCLRRGLVPATQWRRIARRAGDSACAYVIQNDPDQAAAFARVAGRYGLMALGWRRES